MVRRAWCFPVAIAVLLLLFGNIGVRAQTGYTFQTIDVPFANSAGTDSEALGLNNAGAIVGTYLGTDGSYHGFLDVGGTFTAIDAYSYINGTHGTIARRDNDLAQIVGRYRDASGTEHGFLLMGASLSLFTTIDMPLSFGAVAQRVLGINDSGQMVGYYCVGTAFQFTSCANFGLPVGMHGFFRDRDQSFSAIDYPGAVATRSTSINALGQIAGFFRFSTGNGHGFLLTQGSYHQIDAPFNPTRGNGITEVNNQGQFVGFYHDSNGVEHGYLFDGVDFMQIQPPAAVASEADSMNERGQIVGLYVDSNGKIHGFLATPAQ